jgi:phosphatidylinositol alpha-1,6-mannosyltransferase
MITPWTFEIIRFCLKNKPDVVFIGQLFPVGFLGLITLRFFNIPYIVFVHGEELTISKHIGGYRWSVNSHILKKAFRIVANSAFTRRQVVSAGIDSTRVEKITPMVDTEIFHPYHDTTHLKEKLSIEEEKILLSIGRLIPRKGHSKVISILPRLISELGKIKYIIVGDDFGEGAKLKKLVKDLNVEKSVIFAGRVSADELPKYYCLCDIMVLPNYELTDKDNEGFGIVFLEANACGKPVIGGRSGGTEDAVIHGETGLLVDANEESSLYEAVAVLLKNEPYAVRLGQNGRRRVLTSFHWDTATKAVRKLSFQAMHKHT